ncbi:MAG TPA: hypothetical protein VGM77_06015 [Gemmatimonadales bacterium]|jgi:hypothetical protein
MPRRLRAALVVAGLWAIGWSLAGFLFGLVYWFRLPAYEMRRFTFISWILHSMLPYAIGGAICGLGFAILLGRAERERTVGELSIARTALWGAMAAFLSMTLVCMVMQVTNGYSLRPFWIAETAGICAVVGAISAGGSLATARRGRVAAAVEPERIAAGSV